MEKTTPSIATRLAFGFGIAFLVLLASLHFLEPEFDPSWRVISEYAIGQYGFLMALAFFCWGGGFLALTVALWHSLPTRGGSIGKWWLVAISFAVMGAGIFTTSPITQTVRSNGDMVHAICGTIMIFTFPIASTLIARSLWHNHIFKPYGSTLLWFTVLVWLGFLSFLGATIIFKPNGREYNASVWIGYPNRFLAVAYTLWLLVLARLTNRLQSHEQ